MVGMRRKLGLEEAMARSMPAATKPAQPATLALAAAALSLATAAVTGRDVGPSA